MYVESMIRSTVITSLLGFSVFSYGMYDRTLCLFVIFLFFTSIYYSQFLCYFVQFRNPSNLSVLMVPQTETCQTLEI